jgi:hypothetical protein
MRMTIFAKLFLILGVASITYGLARWQIVHEVLSRQERHFQQFAAAHTAEFSQPTNSVTPHDLGRLHMQVMLSGGLYPGWPQAVIPCAAGLMSLAASCYFARRTGAKRDAKA